MTRVSFAQFILVTRQTQLSDYKHIFATVSAIDMAQDRAELAITPFIALCKSASSHRAASDLITQATTATGTYTFSDLLAQPNIRNLKTDTQYSAYHNLLEVFAWGTWETYKQTSNLPNLSDPQILKLRLLSLLSFAAEKIPDLSYRRLCERLELDSAVDLEHLVTTAIYSDLLTATINPATQYIQITSIAPVRDLAPGSVKDMLQELENWSARCDNVLHELEAEITKVKADASKRAARQTQVASQLAAAAEANEKAATSVNSRSGAQGVGVSSPHKQSKTQKRDQAAVEEEDGLPADDDDAMDVDGQASGVKKKPAAGLLGRLKSK